MRIPILTFGAIASVLTINSVMADTVVTSRNYVDTQDALKQDKITAGTTGSVVTYNGTQNGQAQFSERAIFDPNTNFDFENNEVATGHEGDLLDAGSIFPDLVRMSNDIQDIQDNMPIMPTGERDTVVMYNGPGGQIGGERGIYDGATTYDSSTDADKLVTASVVQNVSNNMPKTTVTYKTCTRWVDNAEHTDANCLLWDLTNKNVFGTCAGRNDCAGLDCSGVPASHPDCINGECICDAGIK